jgi:hypothetical protein
MRDGWLNPPPDLFGCGLGEAPAGFNQLDLLFGTTSVDKNASKRQELS